MEIIADTNTFLAVALDEPEKDMIIGLTKNVSLTGPEILPYEIGNALSAMLKKHVLDEHEIVKVWDIVQLIPVKLRRIDIKSALKIAARYNLYAYDAYFLECAVNLGCPLLTLDRQLNNVAARIGIQTLYGEKI